MPWAHHWPLYKACRRGARRRRDAALVARECANRLLRVMTLSAEPWNESWNGAVSAACNQRTASTEAALSVQAERLGRWGVLMVRRRSTVRFRKGLCSSEAKFELNLDDRLARRWGLLGL